jgi:hypothetical protein
MSSLKPEEDYLDEDKPFRLMVKKQNFCIISMLTPNSFPENKRDEFKDQKILGVKVRGVFETYDDAKKYAEIYQKQDKYHNIFVGEIGKWLPFNVDISTMETEDDPVYREKSLNQYMKSYKDSLKEEEISEKERKEEQLKGAKVVTGKTDAPIYTGIGNPEITPAGKIPSSNLDDNTDNNLDDHDDTDDKSADYTNIQTNNVDDEINNTQKEKVKLEESLKDSKNNLKELEAKLATINEIYADLKNQ